MKFTWFNLMPWPYLPDKLWEAHRSVWVDIPNSLYRLSAPTLVLWGASDRLIVPAYARRWAELIPGARVTSMPEAGHMLPYEQPEAFARAVADFVG